MEHLSALSFNVRETLWKVESIRQKILQFQSTNTVDQQLQLSLKENINSCMSGLLIVYDILTEIEETLSAYEITNLFNNKQVN